MKSKINFPQKTSDRTKRLGSFGCTQFISLMLITYPMQNYSVSDLNIAHRSSGSRALDVSAWHGSDSLSLYFKIQRSERWHAWCLFSFPETFLCVRKKHTVKKCEKKKKQKHTYTKKKHMIMVMVVWLAVGENLTNCIMICWLRDVSIMHC